jgi:ribosomal subunit interface protein
MNPTGRNSVITVESAAVDLGEALPARAREAITEVAAKYFGDLVAAAVYFNREGPAYRSTVNIQIGGLDQVTAEASEHDCHRAFDVALERAAKQLRRLKRRIREDKPARLKNAALDMDAGRS